MNDILRTLQTGARVIDVRTLAEYVEGHLDGSINIPLNEIPGRLDEFNDPYGVILCCASGIRSSKAAGLLRQNGIKCLDGGSWLNLRGLTSVNAG